MNRYQIIVHDPRGFVTDVRTFSRLTNPSEAMIGMQRQYADAGLGPDTSGHKFEVICPAIDWRLSSKRPWRWERDD